MATSTDIVKKQLVYWAQVTPVAAGPAVAIPYAQQNGPGLLAGLHTVAGLYPITMPANFTIPINRRMIVVTPETAVVDAALQYDPITAPAANVVTIQTRAAGALVDTVGFQIFIYRVEMLP